MKIQLKKIVFLKQQEKELQDRLEKIREEIRFIESLTEEQLSFYEKRALDRNICVRSSSEQASFVQYIKEELKKQGRTYNWLAAHIGKSLSSIHGWVYGTRPISEENISKIEAALKKGFKQ